MIDREAQRKVQRKAFPGLYRASLIASWVMCIGLVAVVAAFPAYYFDANKLGNLLLFGGAYASICGFSLLKVLTNEMSKRWLFAEHLVAGDDKGRSVEDKEGRD